MALQKISSNCFQGIQITDISQIADWATKRKSIYVVSGYGWGMISPASWAMCWQTKRLYDLVNSGKVFYCIHKNDLHIDD